VATTITPTPGAKSATADAARARKKLPIRPWLRALHRDVGYLAVGFTVIYAVSGLSVNHIADLGDPSFKDVNRTHQLARRPPGASTSSEAVTSSVLAQLGITQKPSDVYRASDTELDITLTEEHRLHVDLARGTIQEEAREPRFFLRLANWLHLNRGKKAWTYLADGYAVFLLFLAASGLFMIPGKKGLLGRGGVFVAAGVLVPVLYVVLSGGP
jgi:hypothetical protein